MSNCTPIQSGANETYTPNPFENTDNIKFYHNNVPRFGNTNEILHLFQGTPDQQKEYIQGLLASPIALAVTIMAWIVTLCVFKCFLCCCQDHHWLAGTPVPLPKEPTSKGDGDNNAIGIDVEKNSPDGPTVELTAVKEDANHAEWRKEYDRILWQKSIIKSIVAFALFVLYITGIVLSSVGVNGLEFAIDTGVEAVSIVGGRMRDGVKFLDDALQVDQLINNDVNSLLVSLNGICPNQTEQICSNLRDPNSCESIDGLSIVSEMKQAISYIQDDRPHVQVIQDARSALNDIVTQTTSIDTELGPVNRALGVTYTFGVIVMLIGICLGLVLFMSMPELAKFILFSLSYGLLVVIVLFSFIMLIVVLPVSSAVGDVCYNAPDSRIETILRENMGTSTPDQIQDMVFNIINGCSAQEASLVETIDFETEGFDSGIAQLNQNETLFVCGTPPNATETLETTLNDGVNVHMCEALSIMTEFGDFFACRFWHPIYVQAVHESICYEAMDALSAITNTLFVILCMSLLIMTFRVALWDAVVSRSTTKNKNRGDVFASVANVDPEKKIKKSNSRRSDWGE